MSIFGQDRPKAEMSAKIAALREQLVDSLQSQFDREIERSLRRIDEAIAPYTRFVRAERGKLLDTQTELQEIKNKLDHLKVQVEEM
jgi:hypothetical protein